MLCKIYLVRHHSSKIFFTFDDIHKAFFKDLIQIITTLKTYIAENKNRQCMCKENTVKSLHCSTLNKESHQN